jgi:hypothetical protein
MSGIDPLESASESVDTMAFGKKLLKYSSPAGFVAVRAAEKRAESDQGMTPPDAETVAPEPAIAPDARTDEGVELEVRQDTTGGQSQIGGGSVDEPLVTPEPAPSKRELRKAERAEKMAVLRAEREENKAVEREAEEALKSLRKSRGRQLWADGRMVFVPLTPEAILDVDESRIVTKSRIYPLSPDTVASLEVSGNIVATSSRKTMTRTVAFGVFASQKKGKIVDQRQLMLQVEDHALGWAFTLPGPANAEVRARTFIQNIDLAVSALAPEADQTQPHADEAQPRVEAIDIPEQIRKLAELRDSGILSDGEFDTKKQELLTRM